MHPVLHPEKAWLNQPSSSAYSSKSLHCIEFIWSYFIHTYLKHLDKYLILFCHSNNHNMTHSKVIFLHVFPPSATSIHLYWQLSRGWERAIIYLSQHDGTEGLLLYLCNSFIHQTALVVFRYGSHHISVQKCNVLSCLTFSFVFTAPLWCVYHKVQNLFENVSTRTLFEID